MRDPRKQTRIDNLQNRLARTERYLARLRRVEGRYPWIRLGVVIVDVAAIYFAFQLLPWLAAWAVLILAAATFIIAMILHQRVIDAIERIEALRASVLGLIARATLDWPAIPAAPPFPVDPDHPFALDLYLPQIHHLLDTTASLGGSQRLSSWLANLHPNLESITQRHALVRALLDLPGFRARLLVNGILLRHGQLAERWDGESIARWLEARAQTASLLPYLLAGGVLALLNITLFALFAFGLLPALWIVTLIAYMALQAFKFREASETFDEAYSLARQLERYRIVLLDLEDYPYPAGGPLSKLGAVYRNIGQRPSQSLRRIGRIVSAASLRNNPMLALLLNLLVPWDLFFAYQLERYKRELRGLLPGWLDAWYELEALNALAIFAELNPETTFPDLRSGDPVFAARAIAHPLIPDNERVANDFTLNHLGQVVIITGSNMSGKSTFLRTLGSNLALAYAGAPVVADSLQTNLFRLFTSMTLSDSLESGISFFYAEVRRLKALLDALEAKDGLPLFFLIDEIFRGTNNRERQIGSRSLTEALAGKHGAGLISTHDLELVHLAETIPAVSNMHFREEVHGEKMVFDYTIRSGASPTTNALRIMELAGLPVKK